ncbi:glycoside hydrolase family 16 protein [Streptomyces yaanensis]|uniref:Glycoside hydrolase family 16 protein n=1 Tax=Streptomyces yaanensis TaxID=1142239 RepID=A0ABV7SGB6_9ACTN|nr:glycoside hydrolase family 16 protein [Streptomyces sp. CGMCC 4.7035]WNB98474.1 glycoside hydrolase family 16 protein [Streptomyces sp. CGMCC 4.7035]
MRSSSEARKMSRHRHLPGHRPRGVIALALAALMAAFFVPGAAAAVAPSEDACHATGDVMPRGDCGPFHQVFAENFNGDLVPLGSFSDCDHNADTPSAYCGALTGSYRADWWAYPRGWYDTADPRNHSNGNTRLLGGEYRADDTVWVGPADNGDGRMHIRMYRPRSGGDIHSAAVVPKRIMNQAYGKISARVRVVKAAPGYKSAWLYYGDACEMDFYEQNWVDTVHFFHHPCDGRGQSYADTGKPFTDWHTVSLEWTPGHARYYLDGHLYLHDTRAVPSRPLSAVLQNESALYGAYAAPGSWAQLDITWVTAYAYAGRASVV